jgi:hypothetical protein
MYLHYLLSKAVLAVAAMAGAEIPMMSHLEYLKVDSLALERAQVPAEILVRVYIAELDNNFDYSSFLSNCLLILYRDQYKLL